MNSRGMPADPHKCGIKVAECFDRRVASEWRELSGAGVWSCVRECRSDEGSSDMDKNCVHRRLVPVRERGTEYRLATHCARNGAEDNDSAKSATNVFPKP